jgi:hypothetical protein
MRFPEHIQYGGKSVAKYILATFREMIRTKIVPEEIKEGLLTPMLKKNKPAMDPTNYRGITVLMSIEILRRSDRIHTVSKAV